MVANLPALGYLQGSGFDLRILGGSWTRDLLSTSRFTVIPVREGRGLGPQCRASGARFGLTTRSSFRSVLEMRRGGLKPVGFGAQGRSLFLWKALRRPRRILKVDEYYRLAQFAGSVCRGGDPPSGWERSPYPRLRPARHHSEQARRLLQQAEVPGPYVVCCPTAAPRYRPGWKIWKGFPELVRRILDEGLAVVTCPGPGEESLCVKLAPSSTMLSGVELGPYAAILSGARGVISNDTGAMHLAAAVGAPTLGVFGDTSPVRHAPSGEAASWVGELGRWPGVDETLAVFRTLADLET